MTEKIPITVLVQTKNEEVGIAQCLAGLGNFDEVIVVDSGSTDRTKEIAVASGASVVDFRWDGQYPKKKQWQLENLHTRHSWILFMDADETPSPELEVELREIVESKTILHVAFDIDLDYVFAGKRLQFGHRVTKRCLLLRGATRFPEVEDLDAPGMGELEGHYQPLTNGTVGHLAGRIVHNDLDPVASWFSRHNRYSDWEAYLRTAPAVGRSIARHRTLKGRIFDGIPFKPLIFFTYAYVLRAGFLDGRAGFDYAFALAAYYWQIGLKVRERERFRALVVTASTPSSGESIHPRIYQLVNSLSRADGGPARHSAEVNFALNAAGLPVQLVCMRKRESDSILEDLRDREDWPSLAPMHLGGGRATWQSMRILGRALRSNGVILHGYFLPWIPVLTVLCALSRTPVLLMPHGSLTTFDRSRGSLKKRLWRTIIAPIVDRSAHFVVATKVEHAELPAAIRRRRATVVGAGTEVVAQRETRHIDDEVTLLSLSRVAPKKRIDISIRTLKSLESDGVNARLLIAGSGDEQYVVTLRRLAEELGVAGRVEFVGPVHGTAKEAVFDRADIFVLPSDDENFGLAFAEAAMRGLPAVVSDRVAAAEGLKWPAGILLTRPRAESAAAAVKSLVSHFEEGQLAIREFAIERFAWSEVARRWRRVLSGESILPYVGVAQEE